MLSVLIPVYNTDPSALIRELAEGIRRTGLTAQILLLDDGSPEVRPSVPEGLPEGLPVRIERLKENEGRLRARSRLAGMAEYEWLLFLDADVRIVSKDYFSNWLPLLSETDAASGGTVYPRHSPECRKTLHCRYGRKRQASGGPKGLEFNNFLIRKDVFLSIPEPGGWMQYGHEDTYYGIMLEERGARYLKCSNPVLHEQLDTATVFLDKSKQALHSLLNLEQAVGAEVATGHVRILRHYRRLQQWGMAGIMSGLVQRAYSLIIRNLNSCQPSLWLYDLLRLHLLHSMLHRPPAVKTEQPD